MVASGVSSFCCRLTSAEEKEKRLSWVWDHPCPQGSEPVPWLGFADQPVGNVKNFK